MPASGDKAADALQSWYRVFQICQGKDDSWDVEKYDGELGPKREFVLAEAPATVRLVWNAERVGTYPYRGSVRGATCTGTLVGPDVILTAAHCIAIGRKTPRITPMKEGPQGAQAIPPEEIGTLLDAQFNYQLDGAAGTIRNPTTFKVEAVLEHGIAEDENIFVDYALLRLAPLPDGRKAGQIFPPGDWNASDAAYDAARELTLIQHPAGDLKKINAGPKRPFTGDGARRELRYASIDTLASSSGSGVIDQFGKVIGVHTHGGCQEATKYNSGVSLAAIRAQSSFFSASK